MRDGLSRDAIRKKLVFTNHTPEPGGNEKNPRSLLERLGYTCQVPWQQVEENGVVFEEQLDHTRTAFQFAGISNGVSKMHASLLQRELPDTKQGRSWSSISNAQQALFWADALMYRAAGSNDTDAYFSRKRTCKQLLFEEVADQTGKWLDVEVLTLVFAKRFCNYKRAALLLQDLQRLESLLRNNHHPLQIIWAGKPYPVDYSSIAEFDRLVHECKRLPNCAILTGYELKLSRLLKQGADIWLNVPRPGREASGTSGITAAMNGAVNVSMAEGWFAEFVQDGSNGFRITSSNAGLSDVDQDKQDAHLLYDLLEFTVLPMYYHDKERWFQIARNSLLQVRPAFDSDRMVREYYDILYKPCLT
jgi:starch phosphorylase